MSDNPAYWVRAKFDPYYNRWFLEDLKIGSNGEPRWVKHREMTSHGFMAPALREDETSARADARRLSRELSPDVDLDKLNENGADSRSLKLSKAIVSSRRHDEEQALMLTEARRRNAGLVPPHLQQLTVACDGEEEIAELHDKLKELPYLRIVVLGRGITRRLYFSQDGLVWVRATNRYLSRRGAEIAYRARISDGFGLSAVEHWGKTKAAIRRVLLPRAIELLQLEPMKAMLATALAQGKTAVVLDRFVFWYETDGSVGWTVKELGNPTRSDSDPTEWSQGTIISKNFGRIVVLPFTKDDGERVNGYTRNGPGDGPAKPRSPDAYKEIAFERLSGDTTLGLLGELPYGP
ncbi:hypothetical protein QCD71_20415 [Sphingomonas sp. PsM26]|jgi:hypothetical protein|nr:hypothetical protein [Sphingomonas sp. PsM26]